MTEFGMPPASRSWVTPMLFETPSGYAQQSPWLGIANKQLEPMSCYMTELGMTPASRSRVVAEARTVDTFAAIQRAILLSDDRNFL